MKTIQFPVIILYAVFLHICQGVATLMDASALNATPIHAIGVLFDSSSIITGLVLITIAILATVSLFIRLSSATVVLMLPQQTILFFAAYGSLSAILTQHYADGVMRPFWFMFADQCSTLVAALGHTAVVAITALRIIDEWPR